jgi:hypothetical protein
MFNDSITMKTPSVEFYLTPVEETAAKSGMRVESGKRCIVPNGPLIDGSDPRWENAKFEEFILTISTANNHRFSFDPETQSWKPHEEIKDRIPALANPNYVDADPVEMWIDFTTGKVKKTPIRKNI